MASLRCHGDSDCNKTQIIKNFHLYVIQPCGNFFSISLLMSTQLRLKLGRYRPKKIQSSHLKFIFDKNILQIADVALRVVFLLFLLCFQPLFRLVPAVDLTLETREVSAILVFTTKTTQPCPQVFSVNGALTYRRLHF